MTIPCSEEVVESDEIPAHLVEQAKSKRAELIENVADADDDLAELFLEEKPIGAEELAVRPT
jgi:elongation factor G